MKRLLLAAALAFAIGYRITRHKRAPAIVVTPKQRLRLDPGAPRANLASTAATFRAKMATLTNSQKQALADDVERYLKDVDVSEFPVEVYDALYLSVAVRLLGIDPEAS